MCRFQLQKLLQKKKKTTLAFDQVYSLHALLTIFHRNKQHSAQRGPQAFGKVPSICSLSPIIYNPRKECVTSDNYLCYFSLGGLLIYN